MSQNSTLRKRKGQEGLCFQLAKKILVTFAIFAIFSDISGSFLASFVSKSWFLLDLLFLQFLRYLYVIFWQNFSSIISFATIAKKIGKQVFANKIDPGHTVVRPLVVRTPGCKNPEICSLTSRGLTTRDSYNQGFLQQGVFQPGVLSTRGLTTRGSYNHGFLHKSTRVLQPGVLPSRISYNQGSYNQWFLQQGVLQPGVLPSRISYNQGSYNQGFLQQGVLQPGLLTSRASYNQGSYNQGFFQSGVLTTRVLNS